MTPPKYGHNMGTLRNGYAAGLCLFFLFFHAAAFNDSEPLSLALELKGLPECAVSWCIYFPSTAFSVDSHKFSDWNGS